MPGTMGKCGGARIIRHQPNHFIPIYVKSLLYNSWSFILSKSVSSKIKPKLDWFIVEFKAKL